MRIEAACHRAAPVLVGMALLAAMITAGAGSERDQWHFKVYLDGDEIGYHDFTVRDRGGVKQVETEARFKAKFLFFTAYAYHTKGTSSWRGDCLLTLDSRTDDNGATFHIEGERRQDHFQVSAGNEETSLPPCVMTFAYWNPAILSEPRLLNTQTGNYIDVHTTALGAERIKVHGQSRRARHYILHARDKAIELWYARENKRWLRLKTTVKDDKTLLYKLQAAGSR